MKHLNLKVYSSKMLSALLTASMLVSSSNSMMENTTGTLKPEAPIVATVAPAATTTIIPYSAELQKKNSLVDRPKFTEGVPVAPKKRVDSKPDVDKEGKPIVRNCKPGETNDEQVNFDSGARGHMFTADRSQSSRRGKNIPTPDVFLKKLEIKKSAYAEGLAKLTSSNASKIDGLKISLSNVCRSDQKLGDLEESISQSLKGFNEEKLNKDPCISNVQGRMSAVNAISAVISKIESDPSQKDLTDYLKALSKLEKDRADAERFCVNDIILYHNKQQAETNNEALMTYLSELPEDEMAKLPCEVVYNALEASSQTRTGTTRIFNDKRCRDNISVASKMKNELRAEGIENPKVAVLNAASEVTVGGAPAVSNAAEESMETITALYLWLTGGDMDHYYIQNDAAADLHGFHYNPNKCAIAKGVPVYDVDGEGMLQPMAKDPETERPNVKALETLDFLVHASRNMNETCCEQMPCILPDIDLSDLLKSSISLKIDATYFKKVFDEKEKKEVEVTVPILGTITADKKLTNVTTTSSINDIATRLSEKIADILGKPDSAEIIAKTIKDRWTDAFREEIQKSADQMIKLAVARGYNAIVINNLGGGVFMNGISAWADAWANSIKKYGGNLHVAFAIFDDELDKVKNVKLNRVQPAEPDANKKLKISEVYANALRAQGIDVSMN